jgi:putative iron-regulated protein
MSKSYRCIIKISTPALLTSFACLLVFVGGCSTNSKSEKIASTDTAIADDRSQTISKANSQDANVVVVSNFVDSVVLPKYQLLNERAANLDKAVETFSLKPNDVNLKTAQKAWIETRSPWEQSETFAFGPAESLGYDGDLDDWPVNQTDVTAVLKSKDKITPEYVADKLQTTQKGFHTIELLLFGESNNKKTAQFTPREIELLKSLTKAFQQTAKDLETSWTKGIDGKPAYRQVLTTAGTSGNSIYPSSQAAIEEIVQGKIGCLDEVANEKIGKPLKTKQNITFESRFSHNSLSDFKNNIIGVQNTYLGRISDGGASENSISSLVAKADPNLDKQVQQEITNAIASLDAIPNPIEPKINDPQTIAKMQSAQKSIQTLFETVEQKVLPVVISNK